MFPEADFSFGGPEDTSAVNTFCSELTVPGNGEPSGAGSLRFGCVTPNSNTWLLDELCTMFTVPPGELETETVNFAAAGGSVGPCS